MQGLVDVESIEWLDCSISSPPKYNVITYDKDIGMRASEDKAQKIYCDMSRICCSVRAALMTPTSQKQRDGNMKCVR